MKPQFIACGLLTLCLGCGWGSTRSPSPAARWVQVSVVAEGFSASEIERDVTWVLTTALYSQPHVRRMHSVSYPNEMVLWLQLDVDADRQAALPGIAAALDSINQWPDEANEPRLRLIPSGPILLVALHHQAVNNDPLAVMTLSEVASSLEPLLARIPHVDGVSVLGEPNVRFEIIADQDKLRAFELTADDLKKNLQQQFASMSPLLADPDAAIRLIGAMPIGETPDGKTPDDEATRLAAVATVRLRVVEPSTFSRLARPETKWPPGWMLLGVQVEDAALANSCANAVQQALTSFALPAGVEIVRDLDSRRALTGLSDQAVALDQIQSLASLAWSRSIPPDLHLEFETSPTWHSYFEARQAAFSCLVTGPELGELRRIAKEVSTQLEQLPNVTATHVDGVATEPEVRCEMDRDKAAALGVDEEIIKQTLKLLQQGGRPTSSVSWNRRLTDVMLPGDDQNLSLDTSYLADLRIRSPNGIELPLGNLCQILLVEAPSEIRRDDQRPCVSIGVMTRERSVAIRSEIQASLSAYQQQLARGQSEYRVELMAAE